MPIIRLTPVTTQEVKPAHLRTITLDPGTSARVLAQLNFTAKQRGQAKHRTNHSYAEGISRNRIGESQQALTPSEHEQVAIEVRKICCVGNAAYSDSKFDLAIKHYNHAIYMLRNVVDSNRTSEETYSLQTMQSNRDMAQAELTKQQGLAQQYPVSTDHSPAVKQQNWMNRTASDRLSLTTTSSETSSRDREEADDDARLTPRTRSGWLCCG